MNSRNHPFLRIALFFSAASFMLTARALNVRAAILPTGRYLKVVQKLQSLQRKYPQWALAYSIGTNDDGTEIYALRISDRPEMADPSKIGQLVVATHHGDEVAAPLFALYFAEQLLRDYARGVTNKARLEKTEWTIVPVLNIAGFNNDQREEHRIDPNRDYPAPCTGAAGGHLSSVRSLMALLESRVFTASVTVHGYGASLTYPWGMDLTRGQTLDQTTFEKLTSVAASLNGYRYGTSSQVVYPADGAFEDYVYWKYGVWSLLLELRDGSLSDLRDTTAALSSFFENVPPTPSVQNQFVEQCRSRRDGQVAGIALK